MKVRSAIALSGLSVLLASAAFAEEAKKEDIVKTVVPYGLVRGGFTLADTTRQSQPDFGTGSAARFGVKVIEGILRAQIELAFGGNTLDPKALEAFGYQGVGLRRASVGVALASGTTIDLGRVRPGDVTSWTVDYVYPTMGYGSMDGIYIGQDFRISDKDKLTLGVTLGNALGHDVKILSNAYATPSTKADLAYVVSLQGNVGNFQAGIMYGAEARSYSFSGNSSRDTAVLAYQDTVRSASHLEATIGYQTEGIGGGLTFEQVDYGQLRPVTDNQGGKLTMGDAVEGTSSKTNTLTAGVILDSTLFGHSSYLQKDDRLTFGLNYKRTNPKGSTSADENVDTFAAGFGYKAGGFVAELDLYTNASKSKIFADKKGTADASTSDFGSYLTVGYEF